MLLHAALEMTGSGSIDAELCLCCMWCVLFWSLCLSPHLGPESRFAPLLKNVILSLIGRLIPSITSTRKKIIIHILINKLSNSNLNKAKQYLLGASGILVNVCVGSEKKAWSGFLSIDCASELICLILGTRVEVVYNEE